MPTDHHHTPTIIAPSTSQPQRKRRPRKPKRKDTEIPQSSVLMENVADEAVYEERDDSLERATTTATGLDAKQDIGNISKTQSKAIPNEPSSIRTSSGGGPRRQDTIGDTIAQTRLYKVGLFARIDSSDDEASLGDQEDASKQGRKIYDIDDNEEITLENVHDADMFGVHDIDGDEVFVETEEHVVNAAKYLSDFAMTLAQALPELKSTKPKVVTTAATITTTVVTRPNAKGIFIQEQEHVSTPITSSKDKGKGIMVEEPLKMKKKDQVETDYELAQRLQAEKQEELTIKERSKLFQQLLEKRRKHFAAKKVEERRNRPPTKAQQRSIMCTYLKNMARWKPKDLKTNKTREESSSKRAGDELEQEPSKKQKVDDDKETKELKQCMEIILDDGDDVTIEATPW
ncbi:hypothetical protein Tco_1100156 [Tanacetum coccineum]